MYHKTILCVHLECLSTVWRVKTSRNVLFENLQQLYWPEFTVIQTAFKLLICPNSVTLTKLYLYCMLGTTCTIRTAGEFITVSKIQLQTCYGDLFLDRKMTLWPPGTSCRIEHTLLHPFYCFPIESRHTLLSGCISAKMSSFKEMRKWSRRYHVEE